MPTRPLLLLDCFAAPKGASEHYSPWLPVPMVRIHAPYEPVSVGAESYSGLVITGSAASVNDSDEWIRASERLIGDALARDIPVLGVCFGHQLLGRILGGEDAVYRTPAPELGYVEVEVDRGDPLLDALPERFTTFVSHEDAVRSDPAFIVHGRSAACPVHAIRAPGKRAWGVQFHLEYSATEQERILRYREKRHPEQRFSADEILTRRVDTGELATAMFHRFLEICA